MVALKPTEFVGYAQAGQDMFARAIIGESGTYLDIGANHPTVRSNSYALELIGWKGLCVDNSGEAMLAHEKERSNHFYLTDAAAPQNWQAALAQAELPIDVVSYLSLDVDQASLDCLKGIPLDKLRFRVMTVEHDEYARPGTRDAMLDILRHHKYDILCSDVCNEGLSFEIWCVAPELVDMKLAEKFRRTQPTEWREFFR